MLSVALNRKLDLEAAATQSDGGGGTTRSWVKLGTHWADIRPGAGRLDAAQELAQSLVSYRIVVRATPVGSPSRPVPGQRFAADGRKYHIVAVTEMRPGQKFLICHAKEEVLP